MSPYLRRKSSQSVARQLACVKYAVGMILFWPLCGGVWGGFASPRSLFPRWLWRRSRHNQRGKEGFRRVCDPPTSFLSRWLWRLRRHNQREKGDLGEASPPQTPPLRKVSETLVSEYNDVFYEVQ